MSISGLRIPKYLKLKMSTTSLSPFCLTFSSSKVTIPENGTDLPSAPNQKPCLGSQLNTSSPHLFSFLLNVLFNTSIAYPHYYHRAFSVLSKLPGFNPTSSKLSFMNLIPLRSWTDLFLLGKSCSYYLEIDKTCDLDFCTPN
jgi:hypothetical protein